MRFPVAAASPAKLDVEDRPLDSGLETVRRPSVVLARRSTVPLKKRRAPFFRAKRVSDRLGVLPDKLKSVGGAMGGDEGPRLVRMVL